MYSVYIVLHIDDEFLKLFRTRDPTDVVTMEIVINSYCCRSAYAIDHAPTYAGGACKFSSQKTRATGFNETDDNSLNSVNSNYYKSQVMDNEFQKWFATRNQTPPYLSQQTKEWSTGSFKCGQC